MKQFLFYFILVAIVRTSAIKQNFSISTATFSPFFLVFVLLISAPSLRVYYCQQLTRSVCPDVPLSLCLSVCHAPSNCFFFFVSRWSQAIFGRQFSMCPSTKLFFLDFWFRPPKVHNLLPKICTKSPISRLVWQTDRRCLGLPGGLRDGRFNGTIQNVVGPTLVAMATKFGLGAEIQSPTGLS